MESIAELQLSKSQKKRMKKVKHKKIMQSKKEALKPVVAVVEQPVVNPVKQTKE